MWLLEDCLQYIKIILSSPSCTWIFILHLFILYFEIWDILVWNYFYLWCRKMHKILEVIVRQNCKYWPLWRVQRTCPVSRSTPTREPFKRDSTRRESSSGTSPVGWICSSCNVKSRVQVNQNKSITYLYRLSLILKTLSNQPPRDQSYAWKQFGRINKIFQRQQLNQPDMPVTVVYLYIVR